MLLTERHFSYEHQSTTVPEQVCVKQLFELCVSLSATHGLSRRYDGSHHHECDLLWARSPILERHIRLQIWHSKLLVNGGPDLCRYYYYYYYY